LSPVASSRIISDTTPPVMIEANITSHHPNYTSPKLAPPLYALNANLDAHDNETPDNIQYSYMLEQQFTGNTLVNWTDYSAYNSISLMSLDNGSLFYLADGSYILHARPRNIVGLVGDEMTDTVTIDPTLVSLCANSMFDSTSESDVDCGLSCPPCADWKNCFVNSDCISRFCLINVSLNPLSGVCAPASCNDSIMDGNETDIDCGGDCDPCSLGSGCEYDSDCITGNCQYGICEKPDTCKDNHLTLANRETDIDCGGDICLTRCAEGMNCIEDDDCEIAFRCRTDVCVICADNDLDCDGIINDKDDDIDGDGIKNWQDPDDDNDGLCDTADSPLNDPEICTGEDDDDDNDGILDPDDCDPDNDLDNDGIENHLDDDMDGDGILNDEDSDDDNDGIPDDLDDDDDNDCILDRREDDDNDGLSNEWEFENGLDPNNSDTDGDGILDGDEDWDEDGLSNSDEEKYGTDPNDPDTDGDGWEDGREIKRGTDPLDAGDMPKSYIWAYLLVLILILVLLGGGYYVSLQYPDEIRMFSDKIKAFASRNLSLRFGKKIPVPRIPGRQLPRRPVPGRPVPRVPTHVEIEARKKKEEERKKIEERQRIIAARPEKIKRLKEVVKPEYAKKKEEEWITLGETKKGKPDISYIFERLAHLPKKKIEEHIKVKKEIVKARPKAKKHAAKEKKDVFGELEDLTGWKPSKGIILSLRKIANSRKMSAEQIVNQLGNISREGKLTKENLSHILTHLIAENKTSRLNVKKAISSLAAKGLITKKDAQSLTSLLIR